MEDTTAFEEEACREVSQSSCVGPEGGPVLKFGIELPHFFNAACFWGEINQHRQRLEDELDSAASRLGVPNSSVDDLRIPTVEELLHVEWTIDTVDGENRAAHDHELGSDPTCHAPPHHQSQMQLVPFIESATDQEQASFSYGTEASPLPEAVYWELSENLVLPPQALEHNQRLPPSGAENEATLQCRVLDPEAHMHAAATSEFISLVDRTMAPFQAQLPEARSGDEEEEEGTEGEEVEDDGGGPAYLENAMGLDMAVGLFESAEEPYELLDGEGFGPFRVGPQGEGEGEGAGGGVLQYGLFLVLT